MSIMLSIIVNSRNVLFGLKERHVAGNPKQYECTLLISPFLPLKGRLGGGQGEVRWGLLLLVLDLVPDVLIQGLVLALGSERCLVCCDVLRILHTVAGGTTDISEALAPSFLSSSSTHFLVWVAPRGVAWVVNHVLIASRCLSHVEHSAVRFGQFATDGFDGVDVSYFSHFF